MCIICIRRGTKIAIEANVRTITELYNKLYKNFTRSCLHRKSKWKHKFVNYVTVNYVTTILQKSKYLSKCIHLLKILFVFKQNKSVPVNKDQFKPHCSCNFILTRIYLYALGTSTPLLIKLTKILHIYQHTICKVICLKNKK